MHMNSNNQKQIVETPSPSLPPSLPPYCFSLSCSPALCIL